MNPKERLLGALSGGRLDRTPVICPGGMMNMIVTELMHQTGILWPKAHLDAQRMADLARAVYDYELFENYGVPFDMTVEVEGMGAGVDMGSDKYEPHVTVYVIQTVADWQKIIPLGAAYGRARVTTDAIRILKAGAAEVPVIGNLTGPVSVASSLMEPVIYYKELRRKKDDAHAFMEFVTDQIIEFAKAQLEAGADVIAISEPSGTGEILGPVYFQDFAVKYLNKLIRAIREYDPAVPVIVHICGQIHSVYGQLQQLDADVFSFDAVVGIKEVRDNLPGKLFMGNISSFAIESADEEKITAMTRNAIRNGVDILAPACGLGTGSPLANIQAILKTAKGND